MLSIDTPQCPSCVEFRKAMKAVPATFSATIDRAKPSAATPTTLTIDAGAKSSRRDLLHQPTHGSQDQGSSAKRFMPRKLSFCNAMMSFLTTLIQPASSDTMTRVRGAANMCFCWRNWLRHLCNVALHGYRTSPTATAQHAGRQQKRRPEADPGGYLSNKAKAAESPTKLQLP